MWEECGCNEGYFSKGKMQKGIAHKERGNSQTQIQTL